MPEADTFEIERLESRQLLAVNLIADFGGIYPTDTVSVNGISFFLANDGINGRELWRSDGTLKGTKMLADITHGPRSTNILQITPYKQGVAFFVKNDTTTLWISDGTRDGTRSVTSVVGDTILNTLTGLDNN